MSNSGKSQSVLFVCLGNICRSPMAESVFRELVRNEGLEESIEIESAGTAGYHIGEFPDYRCIQTLEKNGIDHYSKARRISRDDFARFDLILAMDHSNLLDIKSLKGSDQSDVKLFRDFDPSPGDKVVPDPYYGDISDFDHVYELVLRTSGALLSHLKGEQ